MIMCFWYILCVYIMLHVAQLSSFKTYKILTVLKKNTAWLENSGGQECLTLGKELVRQKGLNSEIMDEEAVGLVKCFKK